MHILMTHSTGREGDTLRNADLSRTALIDVSIGLKAGYGQASLLCSPIHAATNVFNSRSDV